MKNNTEYSGYHENRVPWLEEFIQVLLMGILFRRSEGLVKLPEALLKRPPKYSLIVAFVFFGQMAMAQSISLSSSSENLGTLTTGGYHQTGSVAVTYNKGSFSNWSIRVYTQNTNGNGGLRSTSGDELPIKVWSPGFDAAVSANTTAPLDPAICPNWTRDWRFVTDEAAHNSTNKFTWTRIASSDANAGELSSSPFNVRFAVDLTRFGINGRSYSGTIVFELINSNGGTAPTSFTSTTMTMDVTVSVGLDGTVTMDTGTMGSTLNLNSTATRTVAGVAYASVEGEGFHNVLAANDVDAISVRAFTTHASGKDGLVGETDASQTIPFKIWTPNFGPGEGQGATAIPDVDNDNNWKNEPNVRWFFVPDQSVTVTKDPPWNTALYDHTNLILLSEAHAVGEVESGLQFIQNKSGVNSSQVPVCIDDRIPIHFAYELGGKATPQTYSTTVQIELAVSADGGATTLATFPATINISASVTAVTPDITLTGSPASIAFPTQATSFGDRTIATGNVALSLDALGLHNYDAVSFRVLTNNGFDVNGEARNGLLGSASHREDWTVPLRAWVNNFGLGVDGPDPDNLPDVDEEVNWTGVNRVWVDVQDLQSPAPPEPVPYEKALFNYLDMFKWNDADPTLDGNGDFQAHVPQHLRLIDRTADNGSDSRVLLHLAADFTDAIPQSYSTTVTVEAAFSSDGGATVAETRSITVPVTASVPGNGGDNVAWLKNRVDMVGDLDLGTGTIEKLAESFQSEGGGGGPIGFTYDQALAVMALTREGETAAAKEILNGLSYLQNSDGSFFFSYHLVDNNQVSTWANTDTNTNGISDILEDRVAGDPTIDTWIYTNGFSTTTQTTLTDAIKFRVVDFRKFTGTIAWVAMAATYYEKETGDITHAGMLDNIINYLKSIQTLSTSLEDLGAVPIGRVNRAAGEPGTPTVNGYFNTKVYAIEHNIDAYSAFRFYGDLRGDLDVENRAQMMRSFAFNTLWGPDVDVVAHPEVTGPPTQVQNAFFVGYNVTQDALAINSNGVIDDDQYLDPQSWGALSFGVNTVVDDKTGTPGTLALALDFLDETDTETWLDYNDSAIPARPFVKVTNQTIFPGTGAAVSGIDGYKERARERLYQLPSNLTGNFVWSEGSEGVVAALYAEGDDTAAAALHAETTSYTLSNGGVPYSTIGIPFNLSSLPGKENWSFSDDASIAGTTWYLFNEADGSGNRLNPFEPYVIAATPFVCSTTVTSYPYSESFETGLGAWTQSAADDIDWTRKTGSTSSSSTGPTSANDGSYYMYTEASSPNFPGKTAIFESPCFDLSVDVDPKISFDYHMWGSAMGTLNLQISSTTTPWTNVWTLSGDQGNGWNQAVVDLSAYEGQTVKLRFFGITGSSYTSDMSVDNISVFFGASPTVVMFDEDFDTFSNGNLHPTHSAEWTNIKGGQFLWQIVNSQATPSLIYNGGGESMAQIDTTNVHSPQSFDFTLSTDVFFPTTAGVPQLGVYFRYQDASNYYIYYLEEGQSSTSTFALVFARIQNGGFTKILGVGIGETIAANKTYGLKVSSVGSDYTFFVDKGAGFTQVMQVTNTTFLDGPLGLRGNNANGAHWDNVLVINDSPPPPSYCASNGNSQSFEYISRVQIGSIDNATGPSIGGYGDFLSQSTSLTKGASETITVTTFMSSPYNEGYSAWIDYNQNGLFTDPGEQVWTQSPTTSVPVVGNFTVPATATDGPTRMRVSMTYSGIPNACGSFTYGEVEDYTVDIGGSGARTNTSDQDQTSEVKEELISAFSLGDNYPNPFSENTSIELLLPQDSPVTLEVFNIHGQLIKSLLNKELEAGRHVIEWDKSSRNGTQVSPGIYLYRMSADGFQNTKRMVIK